MRSPETYLALGIGVLLFLSVALGSAPLVSAYTSRQPILIIGNDNFDEVHGVTRGTGTIIDPYMIEGWEIDNTAGVNAIDIENTTDYFVIQNCSLKNSTVWSGIYLLNAANGAITNNTIVALSSGNGHGILVVESENNTIRNNTISNCKWGIMISYSGSIVVSTNTTDNNSAYGILVYYSENSDLTGNINSLSLYNILLSYSSYNLLNHNICENSYIYGIGLTYESHYNTVTNNFSPDGILIEYTCENNVVEGNVGDIERGPFVPQKPDPGESPYIPPGAGGNFLITLLLPICGATLAPFAAGLFFIFIPFIVVGAVLETKVKTSYQSAILITFALLGLLTCISCGLFPSWFVIVFVAFMAFITARIWWGP